MDVKEVLERAADYISRHGLEDQSDESRLMSRIRHLRHKILSNQELLEDTTTDPIERARAAEEVVAKARALEPLLN